MKKIKLILMALIAIIGIVACQKEPAATPNAIISIEQTDYTVDCRGERVEVSYQIANPISGESLTATTEAVTVKLG